MASEVSVARESGARTLNPTNATQGSVRQSSQRMSSWDEFNSKVDSVANGSRSREARIMNDFDVVKAAELTTYYRNEVIRLQDRVSKLPNDDPNKMGIGPKGIARQELRTARSLYDDYKNGSDRRGSTAARNRLKRDGFTRADLNRWIWG